MQHTAIRTRMQGSAGEGSHKADSMESSRRWLECKHADVHTQMSMRTCTPNIDVVARPELDLTEDAGFTASGCLRKRGIDWLLQQGFIRNCAIGCICTHLH